VILKSVRDTGLALLLTLGIVWGGVALSGWASGEVRESNAYRHSQIIASVFPEEADVGFTTVLANSEARSLLFMFTRALMDAYVSFELIPYGQFETFGVVYSSLNPKVAVSGFAYRGHDLLITGFAPNQESYLEFLTNLENRGYFRAVQGSYCTEEGKARFEITCFARATQVL